MQRISQRYVRLIIFFAVSVMSTITVSAKTTVKMIDSHSAAVFFKRELYFEVSAASRDDFHEKFGNDVAIELMQLNVYKKKSGFKFRKNVYRFKYQHLSGSGKKKVLKALFPEDKLTENGWDHKVTYTGRNGETLWRIAVWFTGSGTHTDKIQKINRINPQKLGHGTRILIPTELLIDDLKTAVSYPITVNSLIYRQDKEGVYAEYILRKGQTIYSDVVLRFTPRVTAQEVMQAAKTILKRSQLTSFRSIPANTKLKIPEDLISPQHLPPNHSLRIQYEKTLKETLKYQKSSLAHRLEGVTVILDAGHGGIDPGASGPGGEREDEYAYDVMCRAKLLLESATQATVHVTIKDDELGFVPRSDSFLKSGKNLERIQTHPQYLIQDTRIGLNLRWLLANYLFEKHLRAKYPADKCIFASFHMDSLHPNAQGLMVYIPGADFYKGQCHIKSSVYLRRTEAKGQNRIQMTRKDRLRAEGYSRSFAHSIQNTCRNLGLKMHSNQPIRHYIIRKRNPWVPAILKYCKIPTRVLIELANLQNPDDQIRIRDPDYRQKLAEMFVDSLLIYFEKSS